LVLVHTKLAQSLATEQVLLVPQSAQLPPPQSMSVSLPFLTPSGQPTAPQTCVAAGQILDAQSLATRHALPVAHLVTQDPPQSTSVSLPFLTESAQVGARQVPLVHTPLMQSEPDEQVTPSAHFLVGAQPPPQSGPVSVPFLTASEQVGVWQKPPVQTALLQSAATVQRLPGTHFGQTLPPQSTSVSLPFLVKSVQLGVAQTELVQTLLVQSEPTLQAAPAAHGVAHVAPVAATPPQSTAVSVPFLTPSGHFGA